MDAGSLKGIMYIYMYMYIQDIYVTIDFGWSIHKSPTEVIAHVQYRG